MFCEYKTYKLLGEIMLCINSIFILLYLLLWIYSYIICILILIDLYVYWYYNNKNYKISVIWLLIGARGMIKNFYGKFRHQFGLDSKLADNFVV